MPRKKSANPEEILTHFVRTRVTQTVYNRLEKIRKSSDCHTIGEAARKILSKEKITVFYRDMTLNAAMEELALIRKELRSIGININQVTKAFHSDKREQYLGILRRVTMSFRGKRSTYLAGGRVQQMLFQRFKVSY